MVGSALLSMGRRRVARPVISSGVAPVAEAGGSDPVGGVSAGFGANLTSSPYLTGRGGVAIAPYLPIRILPNYHMAILKYHRIPLRFNQPQTSATSALA